MYNYRYIHIDIDIDTYRYIHIETKFIIVVNILCDKKDNENFEVCKFIKTY